MKIVKINIQNYKLLRGVCVELNPDVNVFVGENDAGKSTLLEAISIVASGKLHGNVFHKQLKANLFNIECRNAYIAALATTPIAPPKIIFEAYCDGDDASYCGTNNTFTENCCGIRVVAEFDPQYESVYKTMLAHHDVKDIPVELYRVSYKYFSGEIVAFKYAPLKAIYVDTTRKDYAGMVDRFVSENITEYLSEQDQVDLSLSYRRVRADFRESETIGKLNSSIRENESLNGRNISLELRENEIDEWKRQMSIAIDAIPFEHIGFGSQNSIKVELAIRNSEEQVNLILMEEPENNLSHTNMAKLIHRISLSEEKQIFISTHSSFVANKLNLKNLLLVEDGRVKSFRDVPEGTTAYFLKLPGYDTLRLVLAEKVILVEGPTDDLIIQRAYFDEFECLPIDKGIDIISVGALAFKRYCDIAILLQKKVSVVTDNDYCIKTKIIEKYSEYMESPYVNFLYETDEKLNTIEPSVLAVNLGEDGQPTADFKSAISLNNSMKNRDYDGVLSFMTNNKAEWAMRVFDADASIQYPKYIKDVLNEYR
ncbi:MAG: AAA family ATPase [Christensenellaceae bacterium]